MTPDPEPADEPVLLPVETPDPGKDAAKEIEENGAPFEGGFA